MIDNNCIHYPVCSHSGFAYESCDKCKFRRYPSEYFNETFNQIKNGDERGLVGVWIEHSWAEKENDRLIPNYECPHCGDWHRDQTNFCPSCGKPLLTTYKAQNFNRREE